MKQQLTAAGSSLAIICGSAIPALANCEGLLVPEPVVSELQVNISDYPNLTAREAGTEMTFALLLFSRGFEWMIGLENAFTAEAEALGITPIVLDAAGSDEAQLAQIEDMISRGVDAIILTPNSNDGLIPGVEAAVSAGVLLTTAEGIVPGGLVPVRVGYDNEEAGRMAARHLIDLIGGAGTVVETRGALASLSSAGRHDGFVEVMEGAGKVEVQSENTEWVAINAQSAVADALTRNPGIAGVYSHNDEMITGIHAALAEQGRLVSAGTDGHVYTVGIDGTPNALRRVVGGLQSATVIQDPADQGALIVQNTYAFLTGESVPSETLVQPYLVDESTAGCESLWGNR